MHSIAIRPVWSIRSASGADLSSRLIELLSAVHRTGSLQAACKALGLSYRHAWELVRDGEAALQAPLLHMERGKGSRLSELGTRLVRADQRVSARLGPLLDSLASELAAEISPLAQPDVPRLRLHATHGYAIEALVAELGAQGLAVQQRYGSSIAAVAALAEGSCDVCGLHIPYGALQQPTLAHLAPWLDGCTGDGLLIDVADRRQGLMVAPGNPKKLYELADLAHPAVSFINRTPDSGTRLLLAGLLHAAGVSPRQIRGFEQGETTHAAVAAHVASGLADAAFGLETAARQFGLDFVPLANERYVLLCREGSLAHPALAAAVSTLGSEAFRARMDALPGYNARRAGTVTPWRDAWQDAT